MTKPQKIISFFILLSTFCFLFSSFATGETIKLYFFWGNGCPHCANMATVLQEIKLNYPQLEIKYFEVWYDSNNQILLNALAAGYNFDVQGVPVIFIGDYVIEGDGQAEIDRLKAVIQNCSVTDCLSPEDKIKVSENKIIFNWPNIGILVGAIAFIFLTINLFKKKKSEK